MNSRRGFTLIELLVVIAIIAILAVVVVLTLNPAQLLAQSRDSERVSDMATLASALNMYTEDQSSAASFSLGNVSDTYPSTWDTSATSTAGDQCQGGGMAALATSNGQTWQCAASSSFRNTNGTGWIPVNFTSLSSGSPIGNLPVDPRNQTSSGLFYAYNTNGTQFEVTATLESQKYKSQFGIAPQTNFFPEVVSGGTPTISALYNPSGLSGYWPLDEGSGTIASDGSGNGNKGTWAGTMIGGSYYTGGKVGTSAGNFDGSTDYINLGLTNFQATSVTMMAWINPASVSGTEEVLAKEVQYKMRVSVGSLSVLVSCDGNSWASTPTGGTLTGNAWQQVAVTIVSNQAITLYVNGVQVSTNPFGCSITGFNSNPMYIGAYSPGGELFRGAIDDVRLYSRALSPAEIMAIYNSEK